MGLMTTQPWQNWVGTVWIIPYIYVAVALFFARTDKSLLQKAIVGTLATIVGMYMYIILPVFGIPLNITNWNWVLVSIAVVILAMSYRVI